MEEMSFEPLTPTAFLRRSGRVYADRIAVIDEDRRFTYAELWSRSQKLAGALRERGIAPGDRVAVVSSNSHILLEAHYGVPLSGAVLVALNVRLTPDDLAWIVEHAGARLLIHDAPLDGAAREVERKVKVQRIGPAEYEAMVERASPLAARVEDERGLLALNYTSGTTARPKGVMYHHRGAYLQSLAVALQVKLDTDSRYLWTLPMFHCNGWCFTWAVTAAGGTHLCLPAVDPARIWRHLRESGVTHLCGAPTVLTMMLFHADAAKGRAVRFGTGGAAPTPAILARAAELGIDVTHLYGLTETYGPAVLCEWRSEWNALPIAQQAQLKARQGVGNVIAEQVRVVAPDGSDVPADAKTMGEIALRGNDVMLGYYRDEEATRRAAPDGWFRTGDLGVMHPDGYVELRDRAKDIIISGGENISSLEVERTLAAHPSVMETAVVAGPDEKWGEVPVAFVSLKSGEQLPEKALIEYAREKLAHFKAPRAVVFGELPKTSTGKVQMYVLRERARSLLGKK
ncbi:MAG: acyl--CoA ligase family protein [Myxococcales bacterium]